MEPIQFYFPEFISKKQEFDNIYSLKFSIPKGLTFTAGQWIHLGIDTPSPDKSMVRHMSFSSSPDDGYLEFTMDLGSGSNYKNALLALQPGDKVKAFKIRGEFTVDEMEQRKVIFLCGGLGITPVRAIIRKLSGDNAAIDWTLIHVARTEFLFAEELQHYAGSQVRVHRSELDQVWSSLIDDAKQKIVYLCGSARFLEGMIAKLRESGIDNTQIKTESFK